MIRWLRFLAGATCLLWRAWCIGRSPLFDAAWYRARHGAMAWPALHYLRRGAAFGCHPGPDFDGDAYLVAHPDVDLMSENPFWHYVREGQRRGCAIYPVIHAAWHSPCPVPAHPATEEDARLVPPPGIMVSIIIPSRDRARLLARCLDGLLRHDSQVAIEVIVIDNDSRTRRAHRLLRRLAAHPHIRVLPFPGPFNWSAMNNAAARAARGDVLLLLNNDTAAPTPGALDELAALALRDGVGAVGGTLLYPNGRIQHAGITLGRRAAAAHLFRHVALDDPAVPRHRRNVAAVTGACLAIRRELFLATGGLDEALPVTNGDIELCLRLRAHGKVVIQTPHARMTHAESRSRGLDTTPADRARLAAERRALLCRWGALVESDPTLPPGTIIVRGRPMRPVPPLDATHPAPQPAASSSPEHAARHDRTPRPALLR